jgi:hypothetical protein
LLKQLVGILPALQLGWVCWVSQVCRLGSNKLLLLQALLVLLLPAALAACLLHEPSYILLELDPAYGMVSARVSWMLLLPILHSLACCCHNVIIIEEVCWQPP